MSAPAEALRTTYTLANGKTHEFAPYVHPRDMLTMGVFSGTMVNDCLGEFPREWFQGAVDAGTLRPGRPDAAVNRYGRETGQPLRVWRAKGYLHGQDERGWFQWFCRYALGRRDPEVDRVQMERWRRIVRWYGKLRHNPHLVTPRQTLLHWSWPHDHFPPGSGAGGGEEARAAAPASDGGRGGASKRKGEARGGRGRR